MQPVKVEPVVVVQPVVTQPAAQPMITEENVKIVKFQAKNKGKSGAGDVSVLGGSLIRVYFSVSVSAKVKRQRANRRLRRLLCPKTAVMALHELFNKEKTGQEIEIAVSEATQKNQFKAETVYQGKVYTGFGKWFFYLVATPGPMSASPCPLRAYG